MRTSFVIALLLASASGVRLNKQVLKKAKQDGEPVDIEGPSDPTWRPHPILGNTLHKDQLTKIPAVARNEHIGDSVWHSSVEGGEPNPEQRRNLIGKEPMFSYPTKQTPDPNADPLNHGVPQEEAVGAKIMGAAIKESQAKGAKIAELEKKEEDAKEEEAKTAQTTNQKMKAMSLVQKKQGEEPVDIEGPSDPTWRPHPILGNTLHKDQLTKIPAVARNEHIGDAVWHSSVEGGEPNPEQRRNLIGQEPMFSYPTKQTPDPNADPNNHGVPAEEAVGAKIMGAAIKASQAKEAKVAELEQKEEEAKTSVEVNQKMKAMGK